MGSCSEVMQWCGNQEAPDWLGVCKAAEFSSVMGGTCHVPFNTLLSEIPLGSGVNLTEHMLCSSLHSFHAHQVMCPRLSYSVPTPHWGVTSSSLLSIPWLPWLSPWRQGPLGVCSASFTIVGLVLNYLGEVILKHLPETHWVRISQERIYILFFLYVLYIKTDELLLF